MPGSPASWPRKYYTQAGGRPRLFYVAFGKPDGPLKISGSEYRFAGVPGGLEINGYGPGAHPEEVDRFREGYLWEELKRTDPVLAGRIGAEDSCFRLDADLDDSPDLDYFRDTIGFLTYLLDHGFSGIYDPFMLRYWSRDSWRREVLEPAGAVPHHHVITLFDTDGPGTEWFHTRDLRKFGRPDLSVRHTPAKHRDDVIELINRFIEFQGFGGIIEEGREIRLGGLSTGMRCRRQGDLEDPDFNNEHIEIEWLD